MLYVNSSLPKGSLSRPYIYSNFVVTLDGKVQVVGARWKSYWPIGSKKDYGVLTQLRALSDVLIHGSTTAKSYNFVKTIQTHHLENLRRRSRKPKTLPYVVLSNNPDTDLVKHLKNPNGPKPYLVTNKKSPVTKNTESAVNLVRVGDQKIDLGKLIKFLAKNLKAKRILMEGGPTLFGSFLTENLIDEIFLTVTPKFFGNKPGKTITLVEGK